MLRVSTLTEGTELDLSVVNGDRQIAADGVRYGAELLQFAEAAAQRDELALNSARETLLVAAGERVLVDAAGVAANFQRMVRIADSIGIPADDISTELSREIRTQLGLGAFPGARNTPGAAA